VTILPSYLVQSWRVSRCFLCKKVELKPASNAEQSTTLKAARGTDRLAIAILGTAFAIGVGWFATPPKYKAEVQEKVFPAVLAGMFTVGAVIKSNIVRIVDGRLKVGDLAKEVEHVVLLAAGEADRLEPFKPYLEGKVPLDGLPQVQLAIQRQVEAKVAEVSQPSVVHPPPSRSRIVDPAYEAPV
jgi:hypothetical protein